MFIAHDKDGNSVSIVRCKKTEMYQCPHCGQPVFPVSSSGGSNAPCFRHLNVGTDIACPSILSTEPTQWHFKWQLALGLDSTEIMLSMLNRCYICDFMQGGTVVEFQDYPTANAEIACKCIFHRFGRRKMFWIFNCQREWHEKKIKITKKNSDTNWDLSWTDHPRKEALVPLAYDFPVFLQFNEKNIARVASAGIDATGMPTMDEFQVEFTQERTLIEQIKNSVDWDYTFLDGTQTEADLLQMRKDLDSDIATVLDDYLV